MSSFRDRLCHAAERLFAEQGPASVTMRQLAIELGCSPMTPYRYFKDKDEILAAVRAAAFDRLTFSLQQALKGCTDCDADALSKTMCHAYVTFALAEPQTYRLMFDLNQPDEADYPTLAEAVDRARRLMVSAQLCAPSNADKSDEPTGLGAAQWAAVHGAVMLHLSGKLPPDVTVTALTESLIAHLQLTSELAPRRPGSAGRAR